MLEPAQAQPQDIIGDIGGAAGKLIVGGIGVLLFLGGLYFLTTEEGTIERVAVRRGLLS